METIYILGFFALAPLTLAFLIVGVFSLYDLWKKYRMRKSQQEFFGGCDDLDDEVYGDWPNSPAPYENTKLPDETIKAMKEQIEKEKVLQQWDGNNQCKCELCQPELYAGQNDKVKEGLKKLQKVKSYVAKKKPKKTTRKSARKRKR